MSLASDDPEHVIVIPGRHFALAAYAGAGSLIPAHEVEGDLAQEGQVASGGAVTHTAVIFTEGDTKDPVQAILDAPVSSDRLDEDSRIILAVGREVANVGLAFGRNR